MRKMALLGLAIFWLAAAAACNLPVPGASGATPTLPVFPTDTNETLTIPATGAACLVGDWRLAAMDTTWLSEIASTASERDVTVDEIGGVSGVQFQPDGTVLIYARDASLSAHVPMRSANIPAVVTVNGTATGRYDSSQEGTLTLSDPDVSDMDFSARVLLFTVFSGSVDEVLGSKANVSGSVDLDYICSADSLVITFDHPRTGTEMVQLNRVQP